MSKTHLRTCRECGARLSSEAAVCDLCGLPADAAEAPTPEPDEAVASVAPPAQAATSAGVYCNHCGWQNPPGGRFCSMCGARLQDTAAAGPLARSPEKTPAPPLPPASPSVDTPLDQKALSRQVGIIVGAGVLLVVVLFLVTAVSKQQAFDTTSEEVAQAQPAAPQAAIEEGALPPLSPELAEQVAPFEAEIAQQSGEARVEKQRQLTSLLYGGGRLDRAALLQREIAETTQLVGDWKNAGDLFYDWMQTIEGAEKAQIAERAIDAYQHVLAAEPGNLDVRTDMATAYLSTNNPMQGVQEIRRVLEADSTHLHARFNYGIMLALIGRTEKAVEQFEYIKTIVDEASPYYQQAEDAIRSVRAGAVITNS